MQPTRELPDTIDLYFDSGREAFEALVFEGDRSEKVSHSEAARILGLTRFEVDGVRKIAKANLIDIEGALRRLPRFDKAERTPFGSVVWQVHIPDRA